MIGIHISSGHKVRDCYQFKLKTDGRIFLTPEDYYYLLAAL